MSQIIKAIVLSSTLGGSYYLAGVSLGLLNKLEIEGKENLIFPRILNYAVLGFSAFNIYYAIQFGLNKN
jgi:hypothetical protein